MTMEAVVYDDGSICYPGHAVGEAGGSPVDSVDLSNHTGTVVTWTTNTATPPGVRTPNTLAIVEFEINGQSVRAIGQATTDDLEIGMEVTPVYVEELRTPGAGIREPDSQAWDGYRFKPI